MIRFVFAVFAAILAVTLAPGIGAGLLAKSHTAILTGDDHPLAGRIWSTSSRGFVSEAVVVQALRQARYALLGEIHDNPEHHRLQAELVAAMSAQGRRPAVVFEMLPRDRQDAVDVFLQRDAPDAADFGVAVGWDELGWPDYAMYRPIVEAALAAGLGIVAGDTPRTERRRVVEAGIDALGGDVVEKLGLRRPLGDPNEARLYDVLFEGHCELMPREALAPMAGIQRLRDGRLADAMIMAAAANEDGAVLIAGSGHARTDFGVPRYLAWRGETARIVSIGFVEIVEGVDSATDYNEGANGAAVFDFIWFTPRAERADPCDRLRAHFGVKTEN